MEDLESVLMARADRVVDPSGAPHGIAVKRPRRPHRVIAPVLAAAAVVLIAASAIILGINRQQRDRTHDAAAGNRHAVLVTGHLSVLFGPAPTPDVAPLAGMVRFRNTRSGKSTTVTVSNAGQFSVVLPAGRYVIRGHGHGWSAPGQYNCVTTYPVETINAAHRTVDVMCLGI